ncbi:MAG: hypothetical protein IKT78_01075, partial [Ruminiclostridium sp.]|nr:hypothetical protein [Ruminiclostridium sp.]
DYAKAYSLFREIKGYADADVYIKDFNVISETTIMNFCGEKNISTFTEDGKPLTLTNNSTSQELIWTYNENGDLTEYVVKKNGKETSKELYTYDQDGKLVKKLEYSDGELNCQYEYTYKDGNLVKMYYSYVLSDQTEGSSYDEYTYDSNNNLIKKIEHFDMQTITTEYSNGLTIRQLYDYAGDFPDLEIAYTYDGFGNLLNVHNKYSDGTEYDSEKLTYNESGKLLTHIKSDGTIERYNLENTYGSDGRLEESVETIKNIYEESKTHKYYDNRGNVTKSITKTEDSEKEAVYAYDKMNNEIYYKYSRTKEIDGATVVVDECTDSYTYDSYGNILSHTYINNTSGSTSTTTFEYHGVKVLYNPDTKE